ncbi:YybH family protein [Streptomyces griseoluteus]|uniref:YybH family protein n=1 Tax=Streptomyces griseoluteus TaxID=29306 RepID=UPI00343A8D1B
MDTMTDDNEAILRDVLVRWKSAVDAHEPQRVAAEFTDDALFQGLHPYGTGRQAVAAYYAAQPVGMKAAYQILETRRPSDDLVLGYLTVDFSFTDGPTITVYLGVLVRRLGARWQIAHYQVSRLS